MAARCEEVKFIIDWEEGYKRVENVTTLCYLERLIDQTYDDWSAVRRNIIFTRSVWGRLGTLL